jgi:tetratricopeptide (TPR) repeat protein
MIAIALSIIDQNNFDARELGRKRLLAMPESSQAQFDMGLLELETFHEFCDALECFMRACRLNPKASFEWFYAGVANLRLGQFESAIGCFRIAEDAGYHTSATAELSGDAQYSLGHFVAARSCYHRAFRRAEGNAAIRSKLGLAEVRAGEVREGLAQLQAAINQQPGSRSAHDRLINAEVSLGHYAEASQAAQFKIGRIESEPADFLRAATICSELKRRSGNLDILRAGVARFPGSTALQTALTEANSSFTRWGG